MKSRHFVVGIVLLVLLLDQSLKIWVKTHMASGEEILLLGQEWARLHFVENNGMAFGLSLADTDLFGWQINAVTAKVLLSLFRWLAVGFLVYYLHLLLRQPQVNRGVLLSFALILAGALGNIVDSTFYGLIFSASIPYHGVAELFPPEGGYAGLLQGKVVDMFYFPVLKGIYPAWIPWLGGQGFQFFQPVFNLADVAITSGEPLLLPHHRQFFRQSSDDEAQPSDVPVETAAAVATPEEPLSDTESASTSPEGESRPNS